MFPIPWNRAFRKKDGTLVNIVDAMNSGGGENELPDYSVADAGKVLKVGDDGSLEWDTSGSGGGEYVMSWDFTKFGNITRNNVVFSSAGATFNFTNSYLLLFGATDTAIKEAIKDITIYVDVAELLLSSSTSHQRFIMASDGNGFIYRSSGLWAFYNGSWEDSEITDRNFFDNCTIKIYIDSNSKWHIYKNNVLIFEPAGALPLANLIIGSTAQAITNGVIRALRMYSGDYTET